MVKIWSLFFVLFWYFCVFLCRGIRLSSMSVSSPSLLLNYTEHDWAQILPGIYKHLQTKINTVFNEDICHHEMERKILFSLLRITVHSMTVAVLPTTIILHSESFLFLELDLVWIQLRKFPSKGSTEQKVIQSILHDVASIPDSWTDDAKRLDLSINTVPHHVRRVNPPLLRLIYSSNKP